MTELEKKKAIASILTGNFYIGQLVRVKFRTSLPPSAFTRSIQKGRIEAFDRRNGAVLVKIIKPPSNWWCYRDELTPILEE